MYRTTRPIITGKTGVIAAGHYLATAAGLKMFAMGGNAIDAGVAAGFALIVLKPNENGMGGECPILVYSPKDKKVYAISGQGVAPQKATIDWFEDNTINLIPGDGYLGATVPGLFGSYCIALKKFGTLTLKDVLQPAIDLAENGFPVCERLRSVISEHAQRFANEWPSTAEVYLPGGKLPEVGQIIKQPSLTNTLKNIVKAEESHVQTSREQAIENAMAYFYKGDISDSILEFAKSFPVKDASGKYHTSLLEKADFTNYETRIEEPVCVEYKNYTVFKCGPWTQGPVLLQQLKLLEGFNLYDLNHNSAEYMHMLIECAKLAFTDRNRYYGDPLFGVIPLDRLLSPEYNEKMRHKVDPGKANNSAMWENGESTDNKTYIGDTTHLDVVDHEGFMMSATPSGGWIPSSPVIPAVGFPLGTRGQMFSLEKGHPNCLQPGKRPRTTLTPSLAFKDGKPWMVFGTPGGDSQDQWSLQFFLNVVEFGMDLQEAIDKPAFNSSHFLNSFYPRKASIGTVYVEKRINLDELIKLQDKGHNLQFIDSNTSEVCAVRINHETGIIEGAASAKYDGQAYAMGW